MTTEVRIFDAISFMVKPPEESLLYNGVYDPVWVTISICLAIVASYAALDASSRIVQQKDRLAKLIWTLIAAFTMGIGVWAMHFIGMTALSLPCGIYYDPLITLISMIPGILASGVALGVVRKHDQKHIPPLLGSILLGAGIGTMHYTGMAAMRLGGLIRYDPFLFALSIFVAIALAYLALEIKKRVKGTRKRQNMLVATIMGGAISGMHYTAMSAAYFVKGNVDLLPESLFSPHALSTLVSIITVMLALTALASASISRNRAMTRTLLENESQFRSLIEAIPDVIILKDGLNRWQVTNESAKKLFHLHTIPWKGKTDAQLSAQPPTSPRPPTTSLGEDESAWRAGELTLSTQRLLDEHGELRDFEVRTVPVLENHHQRQALVIIGRDITEQKRAEARLNLTASMFAHASEAIMITTATGTILEINDAFCKITGYSREEVIGQNPRILSSGRHTQAFYSKMWHDLIEHGFYFGEIWNKRKNGMIYPEMQTISAVRDAQGNVLHYIALFSDISDRKRAEEEIYHLAYYDTQTRLPNRRFLNERLDLALSNAMQSHHYGILLVLDMDNFKTINDSLGLEYGDLLLVEVAQRIKSCVREMDIVSRIGGDEFAVLIEGMATRADTATQKAIALTEKIRTALTAPYLLKDTTCVSSPSIGVTLYCDSKISADHLLKQADMAMYQAKEAGRNTVRFFDLAMQVAVEARAALESDLRHALSAQQFHLHYQLQVDNDRRPLGAEALIRWRHPTRGIVAPADFIPIAEADSLIVEIGDWVLNSVCHQLDVWSQQAQTRHLSLAVNVSAQQFKQPDFVTKVAAALQAHRVDAARLKIELTESVILEDLNDVIRKMHELMALRVKLSMDDFGTGYSSLSYLKQMPIDQLKIDQSFVRDITSNQNDAVMVKTIIDLAKNFRLNMIAEGVETEAQFALLQQMGCMAYQGYLFGKPVPIEVFETRLNPA